MAKTTGFKTTAKELERLRRRYPRAFQLAMFEEGVMIFEASQKEVPVDTGRLRASGLVTLQRLGFTTNVLIGYGTQYALAVHEDADMQARREQRQGDAIDDAHNRPRNSKGQFTAHRKASVGKWKYLEDPLNAAAAGMAQRLAIRTKVHVNARSGASGALKVKGSRR